MIEVPIARSYLEQYDGKDVLEVGNVLSHYFPVAHDTLDKFERGPRIINQDIVEFNPAKQYDLILSISTFEHIGFDDDSDVSSDKKIGEAISACRGMLKPGGKFVMTVPLGYNPNLDRLIRNCELGASSEFYMRRVQKLDWEPAQKEEALECPYKTRFPYASALLIAEFSKPSGNKSMG